MDETLLTTKEALERLKISRMTLHRWIKGKKIKPIKMGKWNVFFRPKDVEKLVK